MTTEQLEAIRKRSSATSGNWLADYLKLQSAQIVLTDDVPALIDDVERLQKRLLELGDCRCVLDYENVEDDGTFNEHAYEYFEEESE